jgi:hypothetical protein
MRYGRMIKLTPGVAAPSAAALAIGFGRLVTCLVSDELAHLFALPDTELPGLPLREHTTFALTPPPPSQRAIMLGKVLNHDGCELADLPIGSETLNRNALVVGLVGSGKTTTCKRILTAAYEQLGVPFLVIEPIKTEYQELQHHPSLRKRLSVFSVGVDATIPLCLNPLEPVPGFPVARHLDLLKAVFNAAFPMFAGMSYVLEEALVEVYEERGWNLLGDPFEESALSAADRAAVLPDLRTLHDQVESVLARKGYAREIHANLGAALRSRLKSLLVGQKSYAGDWVTRSIRRRGEPAFRGPRCRFGI